MQRREFLQILNTAACFSLFGKPAWAQSIAQPPFFVLIRASTGWDVTLGLDPKVHQNGSSQSDMFIQYTPDKILSAGGLKFGPACAPLLPHARDLAVINGIFMSNSNLDHGANLTYMSSGSDKGDRADLPVEVSLASRAGAYGIVFDGELNLVNRSPTITPVSNLMPKGSNFKLSDFVDFISSPFTTTDLTKAQEIALKSEPQRMQFDQQISALISDLGIESEPSFDNLVGTAKRAGAAIACSFSTGLASQAQITLMPDLDTHDRHEDRHLPAQTQLWQSIAEIFAIFKNLPYGQGSLFDQTTFMVVSDFARTPALNPAGGKDHNPLTNSVLLAGAGVRGGSTIGTSSLILRNRSATGEPRHTGALIDYNTGEVAATSQIAANNQYQFIFPENVVATVAQMLRLDRSVFDGVPPSTAALRTLIR